ncbi:hypothetical protein KSP40_PGU021760 [Platanthera guangdongensis]|uniref:Uncharacterized protein n=1 Tax=Platanthera guangdongensis TaxID=2320717 RepID=A0ABR2MTH9_9ASPA
MVDIASFAMEDFERRMKRLEKAEQDAGFEFSSTMAMAASALSAIQANLSQIMAFVKEEVLRSAVEPSSSVSMAAINGFFSA